LSISLILNKSDPLSKKTQLKYFVKKNGYLMSFISIDKSYVKVVNDKGVHGLGWFELGENKIQTHWF